MQKLTIEKLELVNFMCHSNLEIKFDKMITCIGGCNGAGKSAIMMALGVLFGQTARELERGNKFQHFIKTNTNSCIVRVTINNFREYKFERYGRKIIIERQITQNITKTLMYNERGKLFKRTKGDIEGILDYYNIKFDNPLNFLTQENSKKILNVAKPQELYEFYYEGTEFKDLEEELSNGNSIITDFKNKLNEIQEQKETLINKSKAVKESLEKLNFDDKKEMENIKNEEDWTEINRYKGILKNIEDDIESKENELAAKQKEIEITESKEWNEISTKEIEERIKRNLLQLHSFETEFEEYSKNRDAILQQIQGLKMRNNLTELESKIRTEEINFKNLEQKIADLEKEKEQAIINKNAESKANDEIKIKEKGYLKQMEYLKTDAKDKGVDFLEKKYKLIEQMISRESFREMVIGPISKFVKLKDRKWFKPVSIVLKKSLNTYLVFDRFDKVKLLDIFQKADANFQVGQMSSKLPIGNLLSNPKYLKMIDVLDISNEMVLKQLVIMHGIEAIILIEDRGEAHREIRGTPSNVESCCLPTGDRIKMQNGSLSDITPKQEGSYWFEDNFLRIKKIENELKKLKISNIHEEKYDSIESSYEYSKIEYSNLERKIKCLKMEYDSLKNLEPSDGLERKLLILEKNVATFTRKMSDLSGLIEKDQNEKDLIQNENERKKAEYQKMKENVLKIFTENQNQIYFLNAKIANKISEKKIIYTKIDEMLKVADEEPNIVRTKEDLRLAKERVHEFRAMAQEMESKDQLLRKMEEYEIEIHKNDAIIRKLNTSLEESQALYWKRLIKRDEIKQVTTDQSIMLFKEYTGMNGYNGDMLINHDAKTLDLKMSLHNKNISGSKSTLSGGERSYAFVCLLLSLWKGVKCPVKVLDEFDVFMDVNNRKRAVRSILEFFKTSDFQVILITPLDTSDLIDPMVDIQIITK